MIGALSCLLAVVVAAEAPSLSVPTVTVGLEHRSRLEALDNHWRTKTSSTAVTDPVAAGLFLRTLGLADLDAGVVVGTLELIDARAALWNATPSVTFTDALDVLQANVGLRLHDVLVADDVLEVRLGRRTLDLASRRLVARNEFRNTITSFTGVDATWTHHSLALRAFAVTPVKRLPGDDVLATSPTGLAGLAPPWQPNLESQALLVGASSTIVNHDVVVSLATFWLDEGPAGRQLWSPSLWIQKPPRAGAFDGAVEVMPQWGHSQVDGARMTHMALGVHASVGHRFPVVTEPRVSLAWDVASGDVAGDDVNQRFDSLFGARRFELGPTGLFGPLVRSNLSSPAARLELGTDDFDVLTSVRAAFAAGSSTGPLSVGAPLGTLGELRLRGWPRGVVVPEVGVATFVAPDTREPMLFGWVQVVGRFRR